MKRRLKQTLSLALALIITLSALPLINASAATLYWPVPGHTSLSQGFHNGNAIDISDGSIAGATVIAAMGGTVTTIHLCPTQHYGNASADCCYGFGTGLVITGDDGRIYQYCHMQAGSIPSNVYYGAYVSAGQKIGQVGTTGNSSGYHLHFGISYEKYWYASGINPQNENYIYSTPTQNIFKSVWVENITETDATVHTTMDMRYVQNIGCYIGTSSSYMGTKLMDNTYANVIDAWFNMKEYGVTLTPGTTYYYKFFAIINGVEYQSQVESFKTAGVTYTLSFNGNGGTNTPGSFTGGTSYTLTKDKPTRKGYTFLGWSTSSSAKKPTYKAGDTLKLTSDMTLYAVWKKNHTHSYTSKITTKPTCTKNGVRTYTCSCGEKYTKTVKALGHDYSDSFTVDKKPTCTANGSKSKHCSRCSVKKNVTSIAAKGHKYKTVTTKATTSKDGAKTTKCSACGKVKSTKKIRKIKSVSLSHTVYIYNGKVRQPIVTVKNSNGDKLKNGTDYTVTYSSGRKNVGQYTVTVKFKGNYSGSKKLTFKIVPKGTKLTKVTGGKKQFTAKWDKRTAQTSGYQIRYSTSSKMKNAVTKTSANTSKTSMTVSRLKAKTKYYVKVRTYKTVKINNTPTKFYSSWSEVKSVKTR